jgi:hypothetical protein
VNFPKAISGAAIAAVAIVAGVISYQHIEDLSLALHQTILVARLMPFGVDGLITVGSVVLLQAGSGDRWLGWLGVGPGVAISLFANVESGIRYGWLSATWAGIPAVSFFLATFILENWLKAQAKHGAPEVRPEAAPETAPVDDPGIVPSEPESAPTGALRSASKPVPVGAPKSAAKPKLKTVPKRVKASTPEIVYAADLAAGQVPSLRRIRADLHVGQDKARTIQAGLAELLQERVAA